MPGNDASLQRQFFVHVADESSTRGHLIDGVSFEDAALHFIAEWHPSGDADDELSLIVEDCGAGERQCFRIDLETGQTAPCD